MRACSNQVHKDLVESHGHISEGQHQQFLAMLLAMQDVPAVLIVLADRLQQLRDSRRPSEAVAREALDVFAPLANRLGVWSIKAELEDLSFKVGGMQGASPLQEEGLYLKGTREEDCTLRLGCLSDPAPG
jgi:(p)ppGpp synthase/HD superfamily hydrolase